MAPRIRILSLNIGLKSDLAGLSTLIKVHKLDLVLLQEVRISDEQINIHRENIRFGILHKTFFPVHLLGAD